MQLCVKNLRDWTLKLGPLMLESKLWTIQRRLWDVKMKP